MAKEQSKKQTPAPSKAKKGKVRERRYNRTVPEGFAKSEPKWEMVGGVLVRKGKGAHGPQSNPIHLIGPTFSSVCYKATEKPEEEQVWEKVGIPLPPPSAAGLPSEV